MKNYKLLLLFVLTIIFAFLACNIDDIIVHNKIDRLKWEYRFDDVSFHSLVNNVPAIDEDGNIYFSRSGSQIAKLNSAGKEIWSINQSTESRLVFYKSKLYYTNGNSLVCLDASI